MAKDKNTVLAVDIGGDSLKMAEFSFPAAGGMTLEKFAIAEYDNDQKDADFADVFSSVYNRLLAENNFVSRGLRIAISGQLAFTRLSKLPPLGEDKGRIEQIVEYEAKQTVPYPMDEVIWDYQLVKHTIMPDVVPEPEPNPESGEAAVAPKEPEAGIDEMEALFVAVKSDLVTELAEVIQESGKDILSIEIAPTAFFNAARANQIGVKQCDMILNIGGRCSSLVFADQGRVFARTIPIAGHSVTQQISKEFNISFADAEELKRRHGFVALGGAYEEPDSEVAATISKIARNVMTRLHGEINRSINVWRSQYGGNKPAHLYLGGGSSLMAYTPRFFNEKLRIPVDYLNAFQVVGIGQEINKDQLLEVAPMFSELIGLALKHIVSCPVDISLMPAAIKKFKALQRKKPYFYASCVSIIICLLIFYWGVSARVEYDKARVEVAKVEVDKTTKLVEKVKGLKRDLDTAKAEYDEAVNIINKRKYWPKLMNEIQTLVPDKVWFTMFEGVSDINSPATGFGTSSASTTTKAATATATADPFTLGRAGGPPGGPGNFGGPPGMPGAPNVPGGRRSRGGGASEPRQQTVAVVAAAPVLSEINWIRVTGHSVVLKRVLLEEVLASNFKKSSICAEGDDAVSCYEYSGDKGKNNITSFKMRIKLKETIKK